MANISKPVDINKIWSASGDILAPSDSKISTGWQVEIPPRQYFNYIDNKQDQAIAHINQHGIPVWDSVTEYQYSSGGVKSLVMGSDGSIYRAVQTNTNQDPTTDTTDAYWTIAFANSGDFYTKTQSDASYLQKANNLSDLPNTATARTNLSVYSQAQTYSQSQVNALTTVASAAQAQAQTSNNVLISPLALVSAFQGLNQLLSGNGYQKFPGGLIVQWGTIASPASQSSVTVTLPIPYPNAQAVTIPVEAAAVDTGNPLSYAVRNKTTTNFVLVNRSSSGNGTSTNWISVGY